MRLDDEELERRLAHDVVDEGGEALDRWFPKLEDQSQPIAQQRDLIAGLGLLMMDQSAEAAHPHPFGGGGSKGI